MMDAREMLAQGAPLLFDGGMGTYYASRRGREEERCERANLIHPEEIAAIHREYLEAGCRAIKTNTFTVGADFAQGDEALGRRIIEAGCRLALECAEPYGALVFADIGPAPQGVGLSAGELYRRQAEAFLGAGIKNFLLETLSSDDGVSEFAGYLKGKCPEAYLIVSFAVGSDGATWEGRVGRELFAAAAALPEVDAVGFNCVSGPHHLLEYIKTLELGDVTLSVMPNAGYPSVLGNRVVYQGRPDYFAGKLAQIAQEGAAIVGGCCGTTPAHIAASASALEKPLRRRRETRAAGEARQGGESEESPLWDKLSAGKRVIAVELDPPADDGVGFFMDGVKALKAAGADMITIADCPVGRPRADSSLMACKIKRELGVEPLPHMTCRDRNLNALKALLLGLSVEGVRNVLLVTGDPIPAEDRSEVKSVFNFNSRKLARYVSSLTENGLSRPFHIFGALNVNARNFAIELDRAREKEDCGVQGFLTQPVLSREALENLKLARETLGGKLLGGVYPVVSYRNACFMNNEIAGIRVCDEIAQFYKDKDRDQAEDIAVRITLAIAGEMEPFTDGLYLMTPFRRVELMEKILRAL